MTALLQDKRQSIYKHLFTAILRRYLQFDPDSISIDFEKAVMNVIDVVFPRVNKRGCLHHLSHNVKKRLADLHLTAEYANNAVFAMHVRMITALAFVSIISLEIAFNELLTYIHANQPALEPLLDSFEDTYLGRPVRNGRRDPLFPVEMWNVHDRVINLQDRTNNYAEAAHRRMQSAIQMDHLSILKFNNAMREVQASQDAKYELMIRADAPPAKRRKYQQADERILQKVTNFNQNGIIEFLRRIAHNSVMDQ
jgi:hypothetical protein